MRDTGFGVYRQGLQSARFRVGAGYRMQGLGIMVQGARFRVQGLGYKEQGAARKV